MKADLDTRMNEAEVCRSMGLYDESISIYEQLLSSIPKKDAQTSETIKEKISAVKKEMDNRTQTASSQVTAADISMLKKKLSSQESGRDILSGQALLDSAASFKELGLYVESINEYEKLIFQGFPPEKIVADFTESLMKIKSPDKVLDYVNNLADDKRLEKEARARVKYYFGQEMEKRD